MVAKRTKKRTTPRASRRKTGLAAMPTDNFQASKYYVQYEVEGREWVVAVKDYCKKALDKNQLRAINALPDWKIGFGAHWAVCAYYLNNSISVPEPYHSSFLKRIETLIAEGLELLEKNNKPAAEAPNIQQRIFQQSLERCEKIEDWLEERFTNPSAFDPESFDVRAHFVREEVSQAHAHKIKNMYQPLLQEMIAVSELPPQSKINAITDDHKRDELLQLKEGYSNLKKAHREKYQRALEKIISNCDLIIDGAKAKRKPRARKAPSKEKLVAKVKYCETHDKYQITSVNPVDLLNSKEVWVFNTKTRKLGKYIADETSGTISVKGTSLVGFDTEKSVQKTLRKPEETLKKFKSTGKVGLRKFMDEIKTTDTKLSGRLNADTVILKVQK